MIGIVNEHRLEEVQDGVRCTVCDDVRVDADAFLFGGRCESLVEIFNPSFIPPIFSVSGDVVTITGVVDNNTPAVKFDDEKARFDLIPGRTMEMLAQVCQYGTTKYADRNWEKGMMWGRVFAALMRHLWAFWRGEANDAESGLPHLAHAMWGCMALLHYSESETGEDDRTIRQDGARDGAAN